MVDSIEFSQNVNEFEYFDDDSNDKNNISDHQGLKQNQNQENDILSESTSTISSLNKLAKSFISIPNEEQKNSYVFYQRELSQPLPNFPINKKIEEYENIEYINLLKYIIDKSEILNSVIISENNNFINFITVQTINNILLKNKKICFLVSELKKAENIYELYKDMKNAKAIILQNKGKKNKNDYQSFISQINENNLFIILPNVLYKLLSIGFIKIYDFGLIIFDECHLCDSNHPYNLIMQEFYFFYYKFHPDKIKDLPKIIGFTNSPYKDKNIVKNTKKCGELLKNISENLNCQMIFDPSILDENNENNMENIEYIEVESFMKEKNKVDGINIILMKFFFEDMLNLCLEDYLKINGESLELNKRNIEEIKLKYLNTLKDKFNSETFEKYNSVETSERSLHFLAQNSIMFRTFEDIQKHLINIIQNLDLEEIYNLFSKYKDLYETNMKKQKENNDIYLKKLYKKLIFIFKVIMRAFKRLLDKKAEYVTDRLKKFINKLNEIYNNNSKIFIFVPNRKIANILFNFLNRDKKDNNFKDKSKFIVGTNGKKEENISLTLSTRISQYEISNHIKEYNENKINLLICTPPAIEYLSKQRCDYILIFSELSNSNNDYQKVKKKAKSSNAKLIIFGNEPNKIDDSLKIKKDKEYSQLKNLFMKGNKIENPKDFKSKNFIEKKNLDKNYYYYIDKTEAKLSLKNCMSLYNEINNIYFSKGIKINVNKQIIPYESEQKFKCQIAFQFEGNNPIKINSNLFNDKQSAENECYLQYIIFLHKKGLIDNNFRVKI